MILQPQNQQLREHQERVRSPFQKELFLEYHLTPNSKPKRATHHGSEV